MVAPRFTPYWSLYEKSQCRVSAEKPWRSHRSSPHRIEDSIVVGLKTEDGDERVILFVKPKHGQLTPEIASHIRNTIATQLSRRHVPAKIIACPGEPLLIPCGLEWRS